MQLQVTSLEIPHNFCLGQRSYFCNWQGHAKNCLAMYIVLGGRIQPNLGLVVDYQSKIGSGYTTIPYFFFFSACPRGKQITTAESCCAILESSLRNDLRLVCLTRTRELVR
jgi:hypothetical protein